jgi:hypothetical protein
MHIKKIQNIKKIQENRKSSVLEDLLYGYGTAQTKEIVERKNRKEKKIILF